MECVIHVTSDLISGLILQSQHLFHTSSREIIFAAKDLIQFAMHIFRYHQYYVHFHFPSSSLGSIILIESILIWYWYWINVAFSYNLLRHWHWDTLCFPCTTFFPCCNRRWVRLKNRMHTGYFVYSFQYRFIAIEWNWSFHIDDIINCDTKVQYSCFSFHLIIRNFFDHCLNWIENRILWSSSRTGSRKSNRVIERNIECKIKSIDLKLTHEKCN